MQTDRVAPLSVSTMHPYQLENWCVQWERKRWGEAVSCTNKGDGIRTKSAREGERAKRTSAGFTVKPPSCPVIEKAIGEVTFSRDATSLFFFSYHKYYRF